LVEAQNSPGLQPAPPIDCGLMALSVVAGHYRIAADPVQLAHELGLGQRAAGCNEIVRAALRLGLKARQVRKVSLKRLASIRDRRL